MTTDDNNDYEVTLEGANSDAFAKRVQELIDEFEGSANLARSCGLSESVIRKWRDKKSEPSRVNLVKLSLNAGVNIEWLVMGTGEKYPGAVADTAAVYEAFSSFALIPRYDIEVSAGHGALVGSEEVIDTLAFRSEWLESQNINSDDLAIITAAGDSMSPTIQAGDTLLVELFRHENKRGRQSGQNFFFPPEEGIYVIRLDDHLAVKRIQSDFQGGIFIKSDNSAYDKVHVEADSVMDVAIVGRVVWFGRRI